VVTSLEDPEDYKLFEEAIAAEYEGSSAVERELVLRLASLLWRLRRAGSIETTLWALASEIPAEGQEPDRAGPKPGGGGLSFPRLLRVSDQTKQGHYDGMLDTQRELATRFLQLAKLDSGVFERLSRYEMAIWRQARQTLFMLELLRWTNRRAPTYARPHFRQETKDLTAE